MAKDTPLTTAPKHGQATFLFSELATDLDNLKADIAFLGIPFGSAYSVGEISNDQSNMPTAMRQDIPGAMRPPSRRQRTRPEASKVLIGPVAHPKTRTLSGCGSITGSFSGNRFEMEVV